MVFNVPTAVFDSQGAVIKRASASFFPDGLITSRHSTVPKRLELTNNNSNVVAKCERSALHILRKLSCFGVNLLSN